MKRFNRLALIVTGSVLAILGAILFVGQGRTGQGNEAAVYLPVVRNALPPIIPDTTVVLTEETTDHLESISVEGAYTFAQTTPELAALDGGDVMVAGISANAPDGFLRRVTTVSTINGEVVVETEQATLEDAIQQGELHVGETLSPDDIVGGQALPGVRLLAPVSGEFYFEIDDVVLFDADGNAGTTADQVRADGSVTLEPQFHFDVVVRDWQLQQLSFTAGAAETAALEVTAYTAAFQLDEEKTLARYPLRHIVFFIGFMPVVIQPELSLVVGVDGDLHLGLTVGATQQATLTAGLWYGNGNWSIGANFDNSFGFIPPVVSSGANVKPYAGVQLILKLYGVGGPYAIITTYVELEADSQETLVWAFYGGLEVPVGAKVNILGHTLADFEAAAIGYRELLAPTDEVTPTVQELLE